MSQPPQSLERHARLVPLYHFVAQPLVALPTLFFGFRLVQSFSVDRLALFLFAVGTLLSCFYARIFPLGVQDRLIRLEERLRMQKLLPSELVPRIDELTTEQLIGLRFASDDELVELVRRVLEEGIAGRKRIKAAVRSWRPDHERI